MRSLALAVPLLLLSACSASPPASWVRGGATLDIPSARWALGQGTVDVMPDGRILINGEHELTIDRGGRVYDLEGDPVALLEQDGRVLGPGDKDLGMVGVMHASLPEEQTAWLSVTATGEVIRYDDEGERVYFGVWRGCNLSMRAAHACTLVTHIIGLKIREASRSGPGGWSPGFGGPGVGVGIGIGVGIPMR